MFFFKKGLCLKKKNMSHHLPLILRCTLVCSKMSLVIAQQRGPISVAFMDTKREADVDYIPSKKQKTTVCNTISIWLFTASII